MNKEFWSRKSVIFITCIGITAIAIYFSIPIFPNKQDINNLLTKLQNSSYWT